MTLLKKIFSSIFPYASICIIGVALYYRTLFFDLVYLDDNVWIVDYQWFLKNFASIFQVFLQNDLVSKEFYYRPLINLSFVLDAQWTQDKPFGYHLTNLFIHLINSCLVFIFFRKIKIDERIAFLFALIFVSHPAFTSIVAWIPGRTDSLLGLFVISAMIFLINYIELNRRRYLLANLIFTFLALLTKESSILLPIVFLSIFIFKSDLKFSRSRITTLVITWVATVFVWLMIANRFLSNVGGIKFLNINEFVTQASAAFFTYLGKAIIPIQLSVLPIAKDSNPWLGLIVFGVVGLLLSFSKQKRWRFIVLGLIWYIIFLLPALVVSQLQHEYRLYLPMIGCMIVLYEIDIVKDLINHQRRLILVSAIIVILFSLKVFSYSNAFKDRFSFWHNAVATSPHSPLAQRNLGAMYYLEGKLDQAKVYFKEALRLNPFEPMVHNNLGLIYMDQKNFVRSEEEYLAEISINPKYDNAYYNLGILYYTFNQKSKAQAAWQKAIQLNPNNFDAYQNLLFHFYQQGQFDQVQYYFNQLKARGVSLSPSLEKLFIQ